MIYSGDRAFKALMREDYMSDIVEIQPLRDKLSKEIDRVIAKAARWEKMAKQYPKQRKSFLRPAETMKEEARAAFKVLGSSLDPYEIALAITDMQSFNNDD